MYLVYYFLNTRYNGKHGTNGLDSFGQVLLNFFVSHGSMSIQVCPSCVDF
jgi:hypothetical protein